MMNVCINCGEYRVDKLIDPSGPLAICPVCQHAHPFLRLPIFFVSGASGAGKTAVCQQLISQVPEVVILDGDILWQPAFNQPQNNYRDFFETWLRLGKNIAQSGRPVAIFNAGSIPKNIDPCLERRYFSQVCYLALVCDDHTLSQRLQQRPQWRQSSSQPFLDEQVQFNQWLKQQAQATPSKLAVVDTTTDTVSQTAAKITQWIQEHLR